jgi:GntR family transcriptional regulator
LKARQTLPQPKTAKAPRFRQIVEALRQDILDGTLSEHEALPSERLVAEQHEVSRMTARRALETLELEGLAYNEQRRGRFVSPPRLTYDISRMVSFVADAQARGTELEIEVISAATDRADKRLARLLDVAPGTELHEYTRLFRTGGHAIFVETEHVIARHCPDLLRHDLRQSTTRLLEQHYHIRARNGDITIRMRGMNAAEALQLGLPENHAGIELEQVVRDASGGPFCVGRQMWRGELAEFSARAIVNRDV